MVILTRGVIAHTVIVVLIVGALAGLLLPLLARRREEARRIRCRNNLNQLAKGMATYLDPHGENRFFPTPLGRTRNPNTYNGAEWLAALYWTGVIPDPGVFICPSTTDTNRDGLDLGSYTQAATFGSQTVSYAGMHYYSASEHMGTAIRDDYPPNKPMGSDDTQGDSNHDGWSVSVLFFDSHIESLLPSEGGPGNDVGQRGGLLGELEN